MKLVSILLRFVLKMDWGKRKIYIYIREQSMFVVTHHIIRSVFHLANHFFIPTPPVYIQTTHCFDTDTHTNTHTHIRTLPHIHISSLSPRYLPIYNEVLIRIPRPLPSHDIRFGKRRNPQFLTAHHLRVVRRLSYICAPNHRSRYPPPLLFYHPPS
jgi:hypothetical protein